MATETAPRTTVAEPTESTPPPSAHVEIDFAIEPIIDPEKLAKLDIVEHADFNPGLGSLEKQVEITKTTLDRDETTGLVLDLDDGRTLVIGDQYTAGEISQQERTTRLPRLVRPTHDTWPGTYKYSEFRIKRKNERAYRRTRLPRINTAQHGRWIGRRNFEPLKQTDEVPTVMIDTYNSHGEMVEATPIKVSELSDFLHDMSDKTRAFGWQREVSPLKDGEKTETILVPEATDEKSTFQQIIETRIKEGLGPDLAGLEWDFQEINFKGEVAATKHMRVSRGQMRRTATTEGVKLVPVWEVDVLDSKGRVLKRVSYYEDGLEKMFDKADTSKAQNIENLKWEIPKRKAHPRHPAMLGSTATGFVMRPRHIGRERVHGAYEIESDPTFESDSKLRHITTDQALELLSYMDTGRKSKASKTRLEALKESDLGQKLATELKQAVLIHGLEAVLTLAQEMRDSYVQYAQSIGMELTETDQDSSNFLLEMAKGRYYSKNIPVAISAGYEAMPVDPFNRRKAARLKQQEIVELLLGKKLSKEGITEEIVATKERKLIDSGPEKGTVKTVDVGKKVRAVDAEMLKKLQPKSRDKARDIIKTAALGLPVAYSDYVKLGRMIARTNPHKKF